MQTAIKKAWAKALSQNAKEFPLTQLSVISGKIPSGLRGTLYRNGAGRLERGGIKVGHWFDGDGAILAVHFNHQVNQDNTQGHNQDNTQGHNQDNTQGHNQDNTQGHNQDNTQGHNQDNTQGAIATYRYVKSASYEKEEAVGKLLYGNYGMTAPGPIWNQWLRPLKNTGNTSVLALPDKLLALWEAGNPHSLNLETLETIGLDNLNSLNKAMPYSAHPKVDFSTQNIFSFGLEIGFNSTLHLYRSDFTGRIVQKAKHKLQSNIAFIHDFTLAGKYIVFFVSPIKIDLSSVLIGLKPFYQNVQWSPKEGTQILVFDRESLSLVSRIEAESWYQWHFANGYVDDNGIVVVDIAAYQDFQTNQLLKEVVEGEIKTHAKSTLCQIKINPQTGKFLGKEEILDKHCEFPVIPQKQANKPSPDTYLNIQRPGNYSYQENYQEIFGAIARYNQHQDTLVVADCGQNCYPSEPIYVEDCDNQNQGWVLTVVYNGNQDCSEVWIFDADKLDEEAVCKLALPSVIPLSFHGTWRSIH
jgi:carotenoid cleavage dioxygenase-like enzyme